MTVSNKVGLLDRTIPESEYNKIEALRSSDLKNFMRSPRYYKYLLENPGAKTFNESSVNIGTAVHCGLLEPEEFKHRFMLAKVKTKVCKEWHASKAVAKEQGKILLSTAEFETADHICKRARSEPIIQKILEGSRTEVTAVAKIEGIWCKARADILVQAADGSNIIYDIKTTSKQLDQFKRFAIYDYSYDISAAYYQMVFRACKVPVRYFRLIALESTPAYEARIFEFSSNKLAQVEGRIITALNEYNNCLRTGIFGANDLENIEIID
jgi:exodeoxyribonuclease VIII